MAAQRRRPRIPSTFSTTSINIPPRPLPPQRGRAYPVGAQRPGNVIVTLPDVQRIIAKKILGQIRPRARSSASIRSGAGAEAAGRSGGASPGDRYRQPWNGRHARGRVGTSTASTSIRQ